jgi:hypothetical protein
MRRLVLPPYAFVTWVGRALSLMYTCFVVYNCAFLFEIEQEFRVFKLETSKMFLFLTKRKILMCTFHIKVKENGDTLDSDL